MEGLVAPRGTWESVYHVRPLRRGDYQFGDLTLRWLGPLGLLIRQAKEDAKEPVKVYPNLLDVRRYDLLRRNRSEMGLRTTRSLAKGPSLSVCVSICRTMSIVALIGKRLPAETSP
jgi:uncharacterized protein (DUF58 family)